jgi:hypothetical protein
MGEVDGKSSYQCDPTGHFLVTVQQQNLHINTRLETQGSKYPTVA